jgi:hypothetical protein
MRWGAAGCSPGRGAVPPGNNDWYNAAYPQPDIYGPDTEPLAECWFKASSHELVSRASGYLAILDAHTSPGRRPSPLSREQSSTRTDGR